MGQSDEQEIERRSKRRSTPKKQEGSLFQGLRKSQGCGLDAVDKALIGAAVIAVAGADGALMVSMTRDGGAAAITLFVGDEKDKMYAHDTEEIEYILQGLVETYGH